MSHQSASFQDDSGAGVAKKFLQAIAEGDAVAFWQLMDREGQGYFKGIWFYALGGMSVSTVSLLADDASFLKDALGQIMGELKASLKDLLLQPQFGQLQHTDSQHALIAVSVAKSGAKESETVVDHIPLVLELAPIIDNYAGHQAGNNNPVMTCWKIDTLKCFNFMKNEPTQ